MQAKVGPNNPFGSLVSVNTLVTKSIKFDFLEKKSYKKNEIKFYFYFSSSLAVYVYVKLSLIHISEPTRPY